MVYYRIAWCIKNENKYCFGNWQSEGKLEDLKKWVNKSNIKADCYYWLEEKDKKTSEIRNYIENEKSLESIFEKEYVSIEKVI
tara:strand:+ start:99 stop:347 length:249 start_codon:yes stop_codon:yes gene_type:complete